ncbi:MAG: succinyl-diaminopimelate desuccinylase [Solirubrobacteraceae bacterium]|jgi:succinyl-diaminopimelate desuccinylase|nr:succinyl-diaminopimelate desuccinylase [Solirubrobacteraceae bacterium]
MPLADRLAARALELIDVPSESRAEGPLAAHVLEVLRSGGVDARDAGDTCVLAGTTDRGERPLVLLAGHLDTVPAQGNRPGRRDAGAVHGLGAADMKGAIAVMIELALAAGAERAIDLGFVFFGREELPVVDSALTPLLQREPGLRTADAVIVMEPTANAIHAGCLGNINATWTFHGRSGHSARPWMADNAIHRAAAGIHALAQVEPEPHEFDGLAFTQVVSVTRVEGGIAANVIPDLATAHVNMRYPPGTSAADAERRLRAWCEPHGTLTIDSNAPSGPVATGNTLVQALVRAGDLEVAPKQAWTPVAEFGAVGIDAVNFGPGDPVHAHTRDEQVAVEALVRSYETLERFACA